MLQAEIKRVNRSPRINHSFVCVNCVYEPGKDPFNKYGVIYKHGKLRILLEPISLTLFICPKCKRQHVANEFRATLKERRNQRVKKRNQRVNRTKGFYH